MAVARQFTGGKRIEKDPSALPKARAQRSKAQEGKIIDPTFRKVREGWGTRL
jgi:hypothetical protein